MFTIFGVNGSFVGGWIVVVMVNYPLNDGIAGLSWATRGLYFNNDIFQLILNSLLVRYKSQV